MMKLKNNYGLTLIELLLTLTISFTVMGLVSGVLMQSFRNMEIADTNINLRQEANILIAMINSSHLSSIDLNQTSTNSYNISYTRLNTNNWELTIGNQLVTNQNYDINLDLEQTIPGELTSRTLIINSTTETGSISIVKRQLLKVRKIKLINKKDTTKTFEISTTISRL
jgi:hypothetical protein